DAAEKRELKEMSVKRKGVVVVKAEMKLPVGADYTLTYTINAEGEVKVEADYNPTADNIPLMPKFGMRMRLPIDFQQVDWYGRGPQENYPDRKSSQNIGCYSLPVRELMTEYIKPQDNGNRTDTRWFTVSSNEHSLRVEGEQPLCFHVWDYGEENLGVGHGYELQRGNFINVNIDQDIHGVGGINSFGARTLDRYTLSGNQPRHFSFILRFDSKK
ncbi:MAG: beta-galactosidase, partial [Bacteroidaceae bacterium]|nr:beta-galactosidase [Bacteroidaceae bacterium]